MSGTATPDLDRWASAPVGSALASLLDDLDLRSLSGPAVVAALRAHWRQISHGYAQLLAVMCEISDRAPRPGADPDPVVDAGERDITTADMELLEAWDWAADEIGPP